jgi:hypothetical protein
LNANDHGYFNNDGYDPAAQLNNGYNLNYIDNTYYYDQQAVDPVVQNDGISSEPYILTPVTSWEINESSISTQSDFARLPNANYYGTKPALFRRDSYESGDDEVGKAV